MQHNHFVQSRFEKTYKLMFNLKQRFLGNSITSIKYFGLLNLCSSDWQIVKLNFMENANHFYTDFSTLYTRVPKT